MATELKWEGNNLRLGCAYVGTCLEFPSGWQAWSAISEQGENCQTLDEAKALLEASVRKFLIATVAPEQEALVKQRDRFAFAIYDMLIHKTPKKGPRWDKLYDECLELCNAATKRAALAAADRGGKEDCSPVCVVPKASEAIDKARAVDDAKGEA